MVGLGNIGKAVARRLAAFGVPIAYHARSRQPGVAFDYYPTIAALAEASDVLIVLVPGGVATKHLIDDNVLAALGPNGVLINVSRGSVVDQCALIAALQSGAILAAGLDVYEDEPRVPRELMEMSNVVLLPHIGSATHETRRAMDELATDNLLRVLDGEAPIAAFDLSKH